MGKIKGKFAPLTEELGNDERFIIECTDFEKLIYMLIIYTTHMTRHAAPIDPAYYQSRYGLKTRRVRIRAAIDTLLVRFPNLKCTDGKLSLINSATYESQKVINRPLEEELELEVEKESEGKVDSFENLNPKTKPPNPKLLSPENETALRLRLNNFFAVRGWDDMPDLEDLVFDSVSKKIENYEPRTLVPYFEKSLLKFVNENADWLSSEVKKQRV